MMHAKNLSTRERWGLLRFSIIGPLLMSPPEAGQLAVAIAELARRRWEHPSTTLPVQFSAKSIERWFYAAKASADPICVLERKVPSHAGTQPSLSQSAIREITEMRGDHTTWSAQLLYDNLKCIAKTQPDIGEVPSYATVCRFLKNNGLGKRKKPRLHEQEPGFVPRERRLFEVRHVNGLWHCDFHATKRHVITARGSREPATLFAVIDDRSRLCCHAQWYIGAGTAEDLVHGLIQAFLKRGLPRALLSDNGGQMLAAETQQGLMRLSVAHPTTLPRTPEQNGKQENFFAQIEGRLMAMLEGEKALTLELLNKATCAWVEQEYQLHIHSETKQSPRARFIDGPSVGRESPSVEELRRAFREQITRRQRKSDGTISIAGIRYEVPSAYRTIEKLTVRVARWDRSVVDMVDSRRGTHLTTLLPVDRERNAERHRREIVAPQDAAQPQPLQPAAGIAPLLRQQMAEYAATGFPPAYMPFDRTNKDAEPEDPNT